MSPRSEEYMDAARRHLAAARVLLGESIPENAAGEAYFAMFNAARAALSEEDVSARTHGGVWHRFHEQFVSKDLIGPGMQADANRARELREDSDYRAAGATAAEATDIVDAAARFLAAIEALLG